MTKPKVIFRADGNSQMGLGHVIRSLALAEMLSTDFECYFAIRNPLPSLREQILSVCKAIRELPETVDHLSEARFLAKEVLAGDEIVVLDGYHFQTEYQRIIKEAGNKLVCIDDIHAYHFISDIVINHAPGLSKATYSVENYCELCLGLDYSLLRQPFIEASKTSRTIQSIDNIFICLGGSDPNNLTSQILFELIHNFHFSGYMIVTGAANNNLNQLTQIKRAHPDRRITILHNLNPYQMIETLAQCDLAVVPSSTILLEAVATRIPTISGYYVNNQIDIYKGFLQLGMIIGIENMNNPKSITKGITEIIKPQAFSTILRNQKKFNPEVSKNKLLNEFENLAYASRTGFSR